LAISSLTQDFKNGMRPTASGVLRSALGYRFNQMIPLRMHVAKGVADEDANLFINGWHGSVQQFAQWDGKKTRVQFHSFLSVCISNNAPRNRSSRPGSSVAIRKWTHKLIRDPDRSQACENKE
jgi:hypothetical protein